MKLKKFIAFATSLVMVMSSMTAFAADGVIEGDMNYVNTTIYKVTLPTTAGMSFTLDPQGLTALDVTDGNPADAAGLIKSEGKMTATNESSVPVVLEVDFTVSDSDASAAMNYVAQGGNFDTEEDAKEIQLIVTPTVSGGNAADPIYVTATSAPEEIKMNAASYDFGGNAEDGYTYDLTAGSGSTVDMVIGGKIAKNYDWSKYSDKAETPATLKLVAVFKFYKWDETASDKGAELDAEAAASTPVYSKASGGTITVDTTKSTISGVKYGPAEDNIANAMTGYSFDSSTHVLTLPANLFKAVTAGGSGYIEVTYGNGSTEVFEVTVQN